MLQKVIVLSLFCGLVLSDPVARLSSSIDDLDATVSEVENSDAGKRVARLVPDLTSLVFDVIQALIGQKFNALSLAVSAIHWLVTNSLVIVIGAVAALGICKITELCTLTYDRVLPSQIRSYVTPEHIDTAERFLISAVEKYAEESSL